MEDNTPKVWVVKEQVRRNATGPEPMDYSPAMQYGEIVFITSHDMPLYPKSNVLEKWQNGVKAFIAQYDPDRDFIITTGQPAAIFNVGYLLGLAGKRPRLLVWQREEGRYFPFTPNQ